MSQKSLVDVALVRLQLAESKSKSGNTIVRGEFATYNKPTANKRYYSESIWKNQIKTLNEAMSDRRVFGELDHPADGKTSLKRVSHIVTNMHLEDGRLIGEAEILPTKEGQQLEALLKSGCKVGVSSRGFGSVKTDDKGIDVVQEDYKLATFDFVADPADNTAYPEAVFEGVEFPMANLMAEDEKHDSDVRAHAKDDVERAKEWAKKLENGEFDESKGEDKDILDAISEKMEDVRAEVRAELLNDPEVAGAVTALESVRSILAPYLLPEDSNKVVRQLEDRVATLEASLEEMTQERDKLASVAKEAAFKYYLERTLAEDENAELIRNLIGDVTQYENSAALKERVAAVKEELDAKKLKEQEEQNKLVAEAEKTQALINQVRAEAEEKVTKLQEAVAKLAKSNKELALKLHTEKRVKANPEARKLSKLIESSASSEDEIDQIIEEYSSLEPRDAFEADSLRAKIRRRLNTNTVESSNLNEEAIHEENGLLHGVQMSELQALSGIKRGR